MSNLEFIISIVGQDRGGEKALRDTAKAAKETDKAIDGIGSNRGFEQATTKAKGFLAAVHEARKSTESLRQTNQEFRNFGAGMAVAGGGALMLSSSWIKAAQQGEAASAKLSAMMQKRGEGGRIEEMDKWASKLSMDAAMIDDDPIKEASAGLLGFGMNAKQVQDIMPGLIGQSRLYGQELSGVAMAMGKSFGKGDVGGLVKSGVLIEPAEVERIKNITDLGERQKAMFAAVKKSMEEYALGLTEGMSEGEMAANRLKNSMDEMQSNLGIGAENARSGVQGLFASLVNLNNASPRTQQIAGGIFEIGAEATTAVGAIAGFAGSIGEAVIGYRAFKDIRAASAAAAKVNAAASAIETAAVAASGNAAAVSAGKFSLFAKAKALAMSPLGIAGTAGALGMAGFDAAKDAGLIDKNKYDESSMETASKATKRLGPLASFHPLGLFARLGFAAGRGDDPVVVNGPRPQPQKAIEKVAGVTQVPGSDMTDADESADEESTGGVGTKSGTKEAEKAAKAAEKLAKAQARETEKTQKATERAMEKARLLRIKQTDALADQTADIAIAQMEAETEIRIATIEAQFSKSGDNSALEMQIEKIKADAVLKEADLRSQGMKGQDDLGRERVLAIAKIQANKIMRLAGLKKKGADPYAKFRNGTAMGGAGGAIPSLAMASSSGGGPFDPTAGRVSPWASAGPMTTINRVGSIMQPTQVYGADAPKKPTWKPKLNVESGRGGSWLTIEAAKVFMPDAMLQSMERQGY